MALAQECNFKPEMGLPSANNNLSEDLRQVQRTWFKARLCHLLVADLGQMSPPFQAPNMVTMTPTSSSGF